MTRILRWGLAGLVLAGATSLATPAAADPPVFLAVTLHVVSASSSNDSTSSKGATAECDTGSVLGGGGAIVGGDDDVHLTRLQPLGSSNSFTATAMERDAYAGVWRVTAYAICGPAPAGLEYVGSQGVSTSSPTHSEIVECSGTKKIISGGGRILNSDGHVLFTDVQVDYIHQSAYTEAREDEVGYAGNWTLWAFAVCANNQLPGFEMITATPAVHDSTDDVVIGTCPAGKRLYGVGFSTHNVAEVLLVTLQPWTDTQRVTLNAKEDSTGYAGNWSSRAFLSCAT